MGKPFEPDAETLIEVAAELAAQRDEQVVNNRAAVFEVLPEITAYYQEGRFKPPDDLREEPEPELHCFLAEVAGYHLQASEMVELDHPKNEYATQVAIEDDRLLVALKNPMEYPEGEETYRRKVRLLEQPDGTYRHADMVVLVEAEPEYAQSPELDTSPATRMDMISMLFLLVESKVTHRKP